MKRSGLVCILRIYLLQYTLELIGRKVCIYIYIYIYIATQLIEGLNSGKTAAPNNEGHGKWGYLQFNLKYLGHSKSYLVSGHITSRIEKGCGRANYEDIDTIASACSNFYMLHCH